MIISKEQWLSGFLDAWKAFVNYALKQEGLSADEIKYCNDMVTVLDTDKPKRLFRDLTDSYNISKKSLDEAEAFNQSLLRLKLL